LAAASCSPTSWKNEPIASPISIACHGAVLRREEVVIAGDLRIYDNATVVTAAGRRPMKMEARREK
jgi:hypothetical protein